MSHQPSADIKLDPGSAFVRSLPGSPHDEKTNRSNCNQGNEKVCKREDSSMSENDSVRNSYKERGLEDEQDP
jgi:hypothetical protein